MVPRPDLRARQTVLPKDRTLRFREDGTFHIGVFEDLHFAEGMVLILGISSGKRPWLTPDRR
jgi:hypothetical protein